jgi:hypothetical protein
MGRLDIGIYEKVYRKLDEEIEGGTLRMHEHGLDISLLITPSYRLSLTHPSSYPFMFPNIYWQS